jgi:glycosyltransferase involved in cell wall biosynthesis
MKTFALFFTRGITLSTWEKNGMLEREIKPYQELAKYFSRIYLFTYGLDSEKRFQSYFPANVVIVTKPKYIPSLVYSLVIWYLHRGILKNVDILKTNQMDGSWAAVLAKKVYGSQLIIRCGYEWLLFIERKRFAPLKRFIARVVEKLSYNKADHIIVTSNEARDFVQARFGIANDRISVIPNYVDTERFKPFDIAKERGRIIYVGRLNSQKNLFNLVCALEGQNLRLVLIGDGDFKEELRTLCISKGIQADFRGNLPQLALPEELNRSEVFILPSIYEGNPKVLLEAMSCGLACIGTNVSGIREVITDGVDGLLCETDPQSLRAAITRLFQDKELRDILGRNARQKIIDNNALPSFIRKECEIYDTLIENK